MIYVISCIIDWALTLGSWFDCRLWQHDVVTWFTRYVSQTHTELELVIFWKNSRNGRTFSRFETNRSHAYKGQEAIAGREDCLRGYQKLSEHSICYRRMVEIWHQSIVNNVFTWIFILHFSLLLLNFLRFGWTNYIVHTSWKRFKRSFCKRVLWKRLNFYYKLAWQL